MKKDMKNVLKVLLTVCALAMLFCMPVNAATKTSVKILKAGETYTIKSTSKVKSSKTSVATAKKKSSTKYKITGKKKGASTLSVYNKNGKLSEKVYLLVYNSKTFKYNTDTVNLAKGKTKTVTGSTNKSGVTIKYASSDKNVATVSSKGKITAKKAGKATISAKFYYKGTKVKTRKKTVNVYTSSYNTDSITLTKGETKTVSASISSNCTAKYSSSDTKIAKVTSNGKITAVKKGTATITCKVYLGSTTVKTYTKKVTVMTASSSSSSSISYDTSDLTMVVGDSKTVKAQAPGGCTVEYYSSKESSVTVSSTGKIKAIDAGRSTINVYVRDNNGKSVKNFQKNVIVIDPSMNYTSLSFLIGESEILTADTRLGFSSSTLTYKWSVDNSKVVSLSSTSGSTITVTAKAAGTATVSCLINNTSTVKCKITVNKETYPGYNYSIYLVGAKPDQLYTGCAYCIYIKTDNPDPKGFTFSINTIYGQRVDYSSVPRWSDIEYINYDSYGLSTVDGGYVFYISAKLGNGAASFKFDIVETGNYGTKKTVTSATINLIDGKAAEEEWIDSVLAKCTKSSMDSFEKMDAVRSYLVSGEAGFTYDTNMGGYLVNLTTEAGPYFVTKKWDSYTSPAVLVKFAEKIGGFDYIHNCYDDENWGTHFYCKVGIGDDIRWYSVCPSSQTGEIDHIDYIDFNSTKNLAKLG